MASIYINKLRGTEGLAHGESHHPLYKIWDAMLRRCNNPQDAAYERYGGRGITVCQRWHTFACFAADMGTRPDKTYSLERLDNDKGYAPDNCKWVTRKAQSNNRRSCHSVTFEGRTQNLTQWAEELGFPPYVLIMRINRLGWSVERALTTPVLTPSQSAKLAKSTRAILLTYKGETHTITEWARCLNVPRTLIIKRLERGWSADVALSTPRRINQFG